MTTAITPTQPALDRPTLFNPTDIALIRRTIAKDATDPEFEHFIKVATLRGLNPLLNQICLVIRSARSDTRAAVIQTTIHGLRLIADRTGRYAPGRAATYEYDDEGKLAAATAYILKYHPASATWHEVSDTAFWREYAQFYNGQPAGLWKSHPHVMLAKCAEALALRRAFPEDTSGLYTDDEIDATPTADRATGEIIDAPAPRPAAPAPDTAKSPTTPGNGGASKPPMSPVQRANLISKYTAVYGVDETLALAGLNGLAEQKFGHGFDTVTYHEGTTLMAALLQAERQVAGLARAN